MAPPNISSSDESSLSPADEGEGARRMKVEAVAKGKGPSRKPKRGTKSQRRGNEDDENDKERKRKKPKRRSFLPSSRDEMRSEESESEGEHNATSAVVDSRNKMRKPKAKSKGIDSDSDYSPEVPTKKQQARRQRRRDMNASKESNDSTELLFAGQVLAEEVESYIRQCMDTLTEEEKASMNAWVSNVDTELQKQNGVVLENIRIVTDLRKLSRRRNQLQDQLLVQKKTNEAMKRQAESYEQQAEQAKREQTKVKKANEFLFSLQHIARKTDHE